MGIRLKIYLLAVMIILLPLLSYAENWIEFHTEKWNQKSGKVKKKLNFSDRYYYDSETMVRLPSGDITLWVKEISDNDKYYVKKGAPQNETLYRQVHLWCSLKRYQIIQADVEDGANETMSEEIKPGSYYEKLYKVVCEWK